MARPDTIENIRIIALAEASARTPEAWYKDKQRWYSITFHVSLVEVEAMSEERVLKTFFEDLYWKLRNGDEGQRAAFESTVQSLLDTEVAEDRAIAEQIESDDEDWYQQELAELDEKLAKQDKTLKNPNLTDTVDKKVDVDDPIPED